VKLYADEPGAPEIRGLQALIVSCLARVEVPAALWRKVRLGELDADDASVLCDEFEADYFGTDDETVRFAVIGLAEQILDTAAELVSAQGLRGYDAVQLATAVRAREADPDCRELAAFDAELRQAAARTGFRLVPSGGSPAPAA
jgi:uncharacterized protein